VSVRADSKGVRDAIFWRKAGKLVRAETKGVSGWGWEVDLMGHGSTEMLVCQENYAMVYGDVGSLMKKRGLRPAWGKDQRVCSR